MPSVVDANIAVHLAVCGLHAAAIERQVQAWISAGESLHAPTRLTYEVASTLTRLSFTGQFNRRDLPATLDFIDSLGIELHPPSDLEAIVRTALRLGRQSAYDAAYLVLARQLGAALWTLDGPLARNAASIGFRVQLVAGG